jgi:hypothetical protein
MEKSKKNEIKYKTYMDDGKIKKNEIKYLKSILKYINIYLDHIKKFNKTNKDDFKDLYDDFFKGINDKYRKVILLKDNHFNDINIEYYIKFMKKYIDDFSIEYDQKYKYRYSKYYLYFCHQIKCYNDYIYGDNNIIYNKYIPLLDMIYNNSDKSYNKILDNYYPHDKSSNNYDKISNYIFDIINKYNTKYERKYNIDDVDYILNYHYYVGKKDEKNKSMYDIVFDNMFKSKYIYIFFKNIESYIIYDRYDMNNNNNNTYKNAHDRHNSINYDDNDIES